MDTKKLGRVKEVFIPNEEDLTKIGFKVELENELITIIKDQTLENVKIYRDDFVFIEKINQDNELIYNIEPINNFEIDGDEDE